MKLPSSLADACAFFAKPENAEKLLVLLRWPNGVCCPECGSVDVGRIETRRMFKCRDCRKQFSAKKGTIFEDSPLPIGKWMVALWLHANSKNGISSCELARAVGVTQKTAWHMAHRIRLAMETETFERLSGTVEADETFIGGKHDPRRKSHPESPKQWYQSKQPVFGVLDRGTRSVRAYGIPNVQAATLKREVFGNVWPGATLYTDNNQCYLRLRHDYSHSYVSHSTGQWAIGDVHTNGIENFWCLLKRSVKGTWIRPSAKHIDRFVTDQVFRYNNRTDDDQGRFLTLCRQIVGKRLRWKDLVG